MLSAEQFTTLERKIERFGRILERKPNDELTVLALAEASFRRGLRLEALTAYQDVVRSRPVPEAHLAVAEIYQAQRMYAEAYEELRRLFSLDPENVEARMLVMALQEDLAPPEDIEQIMQEPTSERAFEEARLRLKIQRTIFNRELQERTRNVTLQPGVVIHEYYVEEAKKRLIQVDEQLRQLERLKEINEELALAPRAELSTPEPDGLPTIPFEPSAEPLEPGADHGFAELLPEGEPDAASFEEGPEVGSFEAAEADHGELSLPSPLELPGLEQEGLEVEAESEFTSIDIPLETEDDFGHPSTEDPPSEFSESIEESPEPLFSAEFSAGSDYRFDAPSGAEPLQVQSLQPRAYPSDEEQLVEVDEPAPPVIEFDSLVSPELPEEGFASEFSSLEIVTTVPESLAFEEELSDFEPVLETPEVLLPEADRFEEPLSEPLAVELPFEEHVGEPSAAREEFYRENAEALQALMSSSLSRTRGVTSMLLITREGQPVGTVLNDDFDLERLGDLVRESFDFLEAFADSPSYWVLECEGGIFVMQRLDRLHVLIAIGQAGANFGALRFTMDKMKGSFDELLSQAPS